MTSELLFRQYFLSPSVNSKPSHHWKVSPLGLSSWAPAKCQPSLLFGSDFRTDYFQLMTMFFVVVFFTIFTSGTMI